jgi:hypothetical protein
MEANEDYDFWGRDAEGWVHGKITSFGEDSYSKDGGPGVVVRSLRGPLLTSQVIHDLSDLNYDDPKVGDLVKVRSRTVRSDQTHPTRYVRTLKVVDITDNGVDTLYVSDEYDRAHLGPKLEEEWVGTSVWIDTKHIEPKPVVGELLHTVYEVEIVLVQREGDDADSGAPTDSSI